ncbi:helix-turn-helix transcriptional regulator, partial [Klebsiella pneumoniae]|uniref:helix-turn-helix transcriptional regulator n=1 Tax=Klebsiella pneumoniae TaxID=573 RepID=UPI003FD53540
LLGISPYTVDQRINLARAKLNVANRNEVAHVYRRLVTASQQSVYEPSYIASPPVSESSQRWEDMVAQPADPVLQLATSGPSLA